MGIWSELNYEAYHENIQVPASLCDSPYKINLLYHNSTTFKIFHHNIRGIRKNFDELITTLNALDFQFDILFLTETHLIADEPFNIDGYSCHLFNSFKSAFDGVAIFIKDSSISDATVDKVSMICNANAVKIGFTFDDESYNVIGIYRSPSTSTTLFIKELDCLLASQPVVSHQICIGDININILKDQYLNTEYLNMLYSNGYISLVNCPTRVTSTSASCLDHIFIKSIKPVIPVVGVYQTSITDHYPVFFGWKSSRCKDQPVTKAERNNSRPVTDFDKLVSKLEKEEWQEMYAQRDVDQAFELFTQTFEKHIKSASDIIVSNNTSKFRKLKPWMTNGLLVSIRKRDLLHKQIIKTSRRPDHNVKDLLNLKTKFKLYRNFLTRLIFMTKLKYYKDKLLESNGNSKRFWSTINEITGRVRKEAQKIDKITVDGQLRIVNKDPQLIADTFVDYFTNVGKKLANEISKDSEILQHNDDNYNYSNINMPPSMSLTPVTEQEINKLILSLKDGTAPGIDGIQVKLIKASRLFIAAPLSFIFNLCFVSGVFPKKLKIAVIVPIHKANDPTEPGNYRPISLLSIFSKLLERCLKVRLMHFLSENVLISQNQFGFLENKSTDDAIYKMTSYLYEALDSGQKALAIFLDLAKAFDTVNHQILIKKMEAMGIRGVPLDLFKNYLSDRLQVVKVDNTFSIPKKLELGVPQGTVLGPVLFLIYINELCDMKIMGSILTYADDTVLLFKDATWPLVFSTANAALKSVYDWLNYNLLSLNKSKTVYLPFSINLKTLPPSDLSINIHNRRCGISDKSIKCSCYAITSVHQTKYLGITIDKHLRWKEHINITVRKLRNTLFIFYRLRNVMTRDMLVVIYKALVQSVIQYGIIGWGGANSTNIFPLISIQKQILKIMSNKSVYCSSNLIFNNAQVLDVKQIYIKSLLLHIATRPDQYCMSNNSSLLDTRAKNSTIFMIPHKKKLIGQQHADYLAPKIFNKIPSSLQMSSLVFIFKRQLHEWLLLSGRQFSNSLISL